MTNAFVRVAIRLLKAGFAATALAAVGLCLSPTAFAGEGDVDGLAVDALEPAPAAATMAPIPDETEIAAMLQREESDSAPASHDDGERHCLATAIYFEARGESEKGQKAVAEVILRRTRTAGRPATICGVVYEGAHRRTGCQFSFTCDRASDVAPPNSAWLRAERIAAEMLSGALDRLTSIVRGATFYHARNVSPRWALRMVRVAQIGSHVFYRPKARRYS